MSSFLGAHLTSLAYLAVLAGAAGIGMSRFRKADAGVRIIILFVVMACLTEIVALASAFQFRNNMAVYSVYSLIEYSTLCVYYNYRIRALHRKHLGYWLGVVGMAGGAINLFVFQGLKELNSYFLFFEGILVICMALGYCMQSVADFDGVSFPGKVHFAFSLVLAGYWSITFMCWGAYGHFINTLEERIRFVHYGLVAVNIMTYLCMGILFYRLPKIERSYA